MAVRRIRVSILVDRRHAEGAWRHLCRLQGHEASFAGPHARGGPKGAVRGEAHFTRTIRRCSREEVGSWFSHHPQRKMKRVVDGDTEHHLPHPLMRQGPDEAPRRHRRDRHMWPLATPSSEPWVIPPTFAPADRFQWRPSPPSTGSRDSQEVLAAPTMPTSHEDAGLRVPSPPLVMSSPCSARESPITSGVAREPEPCRSRPAPKKRPGRGVPPGIPWRRSAQDRQDWEL